MTQSPMTLPATTWKENVDANETARFERYAQMFQELQRRHSRGGPVNRALHSKGKVGVEAEFTVLPDLPEHARVGLFATARTYRAYVRFSNGSPARQADPKPDVRGLALKILGVEGRKIIPGLEEAKTQDFLLIESSSIPFRNADEFVSFVQAAANPATLLPKLFWNFGLSGGVRILKRLVASASRPTLSLASTPYFSAVPTQYGPFAARYALQPHEQPQPGTAKGTTREFLHERMAERLQQGPVSYDFKVQFFKDERTTPIEDASVDWAESEAPYLTVARLVLPRQDLRSAKGHKVAEFVERLSFDPWHAPAEFKPLGSVMRARNHAYRASTQGRGAAPEPDGTERFD